MLTSNTTTASIILDWMLYLMVYESETRRPWLVDSKYSNSYANLLPSPKTTQDLLRKHHICNLSRIPLLLPRHSHLLLALLPDGFSDHDIHLDGLLVALEIDLLLQLESHPTIDLEIDIVRTLEVASLAILIRLRSSV